MSTGDRGKRAEGKVRAHLEAFAQQSSFAFHRMPDARAGSYQPTLADFLCKSPSGMWLLEVKEVDHLYRLPEKNFSGDKRSRMRMFEAAGAKTLVVVCFTPHRQGYSPRDQTSAAIWRGASLDYFKSGLTSWDMRDLSLTPLIHLLQRML